MIKTEVKPNLYSFFLHSVNMTCGSTQCSISIFLWLLGLNAVSLFLSVISLPPQEHGTVANEQPPTPHWLPRPRRCRRHAERYTRPPSLLPLLHCFLLRHEYFIPQLNRWRSCLPGWKTAGSKAETVEEGGGGGSGVFWVVVSWETASACVSSWRTGEYSRSSPSFPSFPAAVSRQSCSTLHDRRAQILLFSSSFSLLSHFSAFMHVTGSCLDCTDSRGQTPTSASRPHLSTMWLHPSH